MQDLLNVRSRSISEYETGSEMELCEIPNPFVGMDVEEILELLNPKLRVPVECFTIRFVAFCIITEDPVIYSKFGFERSRYLVLTHEHILDLSEQGSLYFEMSECIFDVDGESMSHKDVDDYLLLIFRKSKNESSHTFEGFFIMEDMKLKRKMVSKVPHHTKKEASNVVSERTFISGTVRTDKEDVQHSNEFMSMTDPQSLVHETIMKDMLDDEVHYIDGEERHFQNKNIIHNM